MRRSPKASSGAARSGLVNVGCSCAAHSCRHSSTVPSSSGNGLLLFFRIDDFELAQERVRGLGVRLAEEPHLNPNTQTKEFSLRDPDGYYVTISAL